MGLQRDKHVNSENSHVSGQDGDDTAIRDPSEAAERGPEEPTDMSARIWVTVLKRTAKELNADALTDRAAALTYYGILAVFPALLVGVAMLGVAGPSATHTVLDNVQKLAPGSLRDLLHTAVTQAGSSRGAGGALALVGLAGALWSASGYIAAFIRASNVVYDIPRGAPGVEDDAAAPGPDVADDGAAPGQRRDRGVRRPAGRAGRRPIGWAAPLWSGRSRNGRSWSCWWPS